VAVVNVSGSNCTTTIQNSKFQANATALQTIALLSNLGSSGSFVFQRNEYNGLAPAGGSGSGFMVNDPIEGRGNGASISLLYNYFYNFDSKAIQISGGNPSISFVEKYNLFADFGSCAGGCAHGEAEYTYGSVPNGVSVGFQFNTYLLHFHTGGADLTSAQTVQADNINITGTTDDHNVIFAPGPEGTCSTNNQTAYTAAALVFDGQQESGAISNVSFTFNYLDNSGTYFPWYHAGGTGMTYANNLDAGSGGACGNIGTSDTTAPSTPSNLAGTAQSSSQVNLSWTASTDNVGVTGYKIFRNGTQVGTATTNSYSDTGLTASTQYSYTVAAYDAAGNNSAQSASANATTQAGANTTPPTITIIAPSGQLAAGTTQTTLSVSTNESATCAYSQTSGTAFASMTLFTTTGGTSHSTTLSSLANGSSYTTYVKCKDTAGNISVDSSTSYSVASPGGGGNSWARPGATLDLDFANNRFYANGTYYASLSALKTALNATSPATWTLLIPIGTWGSTSVGTWIVSAAPSNQTAAAMGNTYNDIVGNDVGGTRYEFFMGLYFSNRQVSVKNTTVPQIVGNDYSSAGTGGKIGMSYDSSGTVLTDSSGASITNATVNGTWTEAAINGDITGQLQYNTSGTGYGLNRVIFYANTKMSTSQMATEFGAI
jgi:chitodextrinase